MLLEKIAQFANAGEEVKFSLKNDGSEGFAITIIMKLTSLPASTTGAKTTDMEAFEIVRSALAKPLYITGQTLKEIESQVDELLQSGYLNGKAVHETYLDGINAAIQKAADAKAKKATQVNKAGAEKAKEEAKDDGQEDLFG